MSTDLLALVLLPNVSQRCMPAMLLPIMQPVRLFAHHHQSGWHQYRSNLISRLSAGGMLGGGGMRMAPSVNLMPRTSFGFGGFGGFGGYPGYYGGGYGTPVVSSGGGGGGLFTLLALGVLGYAALQILPRLAGGNDDSGRVFVQQCQVQYHSSAMLPCRFVWVVLRCKCKSHQLAN